MTAARPGKPRATSSFTRVFPARTNGMTAPSIRGNSSASGTWTRPRPTRIRSTRGWKTQPCSARRWRRHLAGTAGLRAVKGNLWQPGAGGMCLHTIIQDPKDADRLYIAISAAGAFRSDDGGQTWSQSTRGCYPRTSCPIQPPRWATAFTTSPCTHPGRMCSSCRNTGTSCAATTPATHGMRSAATCRATSDSRSRVHAHEPETVYVVPIKSDSEHFPPEGKLRVYRSRTGGNEWEALTKGLPQSQLLRQRLAQRDGGRLTG